MADLPPVDRQDKVVQVETPGYQARKRVIRDFGAEREGQLVRVVQFIWLLVGILEVMLGMRAALKLMAANPANPFAAFVYNFTELFLWPFRGLTITPSAAGMVLELPTLIAMVVYAFLGWLIVRAIWLIFERNTSRSISTFEEYDH